MRSLVLRHNTTRRDTTTTHRPTDTDRHLQILTNLSEYGNTSAGSIPLALDEAVRAGKVKKGDVIACAGFGAGLSWGAAIIKSGVDPSSAASQP